jgi:hypothetical protein
MLRWLLLRAEPGVEAELLEDKVQVQVDGHRAGPEAIRFGSNTWVHR